ncbi:MULTISPECIES: hypothetical protein [unclassified Rhodosalinus]|uniref:hypothetical protein n=1 Tax=unclassified Rhodosalinus TaxID=2630183 RepID=UPI003524D475
MSDDQPFEFTPPRDGDLSLTFWPKEGRLDRAAIGVPVDEADRVAGFGPGADGTPGLPEAPAALSSDGGWSFLTIEGGIDGDVPARAVFSEMPSAIIFGGIDTDGRNRQMQINRG